MTFKKIRITEKELWNLDSTLANIIYQHLVAFKGYERHLVLYSHEYDDPDFDPMSEYSDDTEWFLDELIWTFDALRRGGVSGLPDIEEMASEIFGIENAMTIDENGLVKSNIDEEKLEKMRALESEYQNRINNGLALFAKNFERLWD